MTMKDTIFTEDFDQKQMITEREFNGPIDLVWKAWTEAELLDQWWAPKPWKSETSHLDLREGGYRMYAMVGPGGERHWNKTIFLKIQAEDFLEVEDFFCDQQGNEKKELPATKWHVAFTRTSTGTKVQTTITFYTVEAMKQLIEMGVKEGTRTTHVHLDELLKEL